MMRSSAAWSRWYLVGFQRNALGSPQQGRPFSTGDSELIEVETFHGMKQHYPITMPEIRFALLELLQDHAIGIGNRVAGFVFPVSDRYAIGFRRRFHHIGDVRRQAPLLDFSDVSGIQSFGDSKISSRRDQFPRIE